MKNCFLIIIGKWVPTISKKIHDENQNASLKINLVGLGIGNGFTSPNETAVYADFMYGVSFFEQNIVLYLTHKLFDVSYSITFIVIFRSV